MIYEDPTLHHKFIPNYKGILKQKEFSTSYNINSLGFRDYEYSIDKPNKVFRILMLGDSYTEGWGVEIDETFSKIVEKLLNSDIANDKFEVINAGLHGRSPLLECMVLTNYLYLNPNMVILNFDITDVRDDQRYTKSVVLDHDGFPIKFVFDKDNSLLGKIKSVMNRNLHIYIY